MIFIISHLITLIVGFVAGFFSNYFSSKATDKRRNKEREKTKKKEFEKTKEDMPELISEMKEDHDRNPSVREFFVLPKRKTPINPSGPIENYFFYYEDEHENLRGKFNILENKGYIENITPKKVPKYRINENFIEQID